MGRDVIIACDFGKRRPRFSREIGELVHKIGMELYYAGRDPRWSKSCTCRSSTDIPIQRADQVD